MLAQTAGGRQRTEDRGGGLTNVPIGSGGAGRDLGNGHAVLEYPAPWGRPVAQWIPQWGEDGKREVEAIHQSLIERFGQDHGDRMAFKNRNLLIFPNLIVNDIMAITVRTFYPTAPGEMQIRAFWYQWNAQMQAPGGA